MRRLLGLCLVALFAASPLALNTAQALAEHVRCGDTIYQDTTLDSDVLECPERAITIGADNVTLNLNGHTIAGSFSGSYWGVGVFNHGHSGVTIENGVIRDLGGGIVADGATNNTFRRLSISRTGSWGIRMFDSDGNVIARNTLTNNGGNSSSPVTGGIDVRGSRNEVSENRLSRNVDVGIGVYGNDNSVDRNAVSETDYPVSLGGARARVRRNFLFSNLYSILLAEAHESRIEKNRLRDDVFGIHLQYSDDNQIVDNSIRDLESFGVRLAASNRNLVEGNVVSPDVFEDGIGSGGQDNRIIGNRVRVRRGLGIGLYTQDRRGIVEGNFVSSTDGTAGIYLGSPAENTITGNVVSNSLQGIFVHGANGAAVRDNTVRNSVHDGIWVADQSSRVLVESNTATRNGDDGIDVDAPDTTLTANKANRNADLGIEAVESVIDGGGNRAFRNGNPLQCLNVDCR